MSAPNSDHSRQRDRLQKLTDEHRRQIEEDSANLPEVIDEEDICLLSSSLELPKPDKALRHPNSHKGDYFGQWGETDKQFRPIDLGPGLWLGTRDVAGRLSGQYKADKPRTAFNGHTVKYELCRGTRPSFGVPLRCLYALIGTMSEVFFTEGYKKALALASAGACAISLAGVDSWVVKPEPNAPSEPVDDFDEVKWHGRIIWIVYDSDAVLKPGVQYAERRLTKELESRGAVVVVIRVPHGPDGSKRGIDDYFRDRLAAGVSREDALCELKGPAIAELIGRAAARRQPVTGTAGEQTCQTCPELREQLREHKLADQMRRNKAFSSGEVDVLLHLDFTATGLPDGAFDLTIYDPPHVADAGQNGIMGMRYGTIRGIAALRALIQAGAREAWRVASVGILVKVADHAHQGEHLALSDWVKAVVPTQPYTVLHTFRPTYLRDGKHRVTRVPRSNGATWLTFRKAGHRHIDFDRLYERQEAKGAA